MPALLGLMLIRKFDFSFHKIHDCTRDEALKLNMQALGINVENIDAIFISHGHHNHAHI